MLPLIPHFGRRISRQFSSKSQSFNLFSTEPFVHEQKKGKPWFKWSLASLLLWSMAYDYSSAKTTIKFMNKVFDTDDEISLSPIEIPSFFLTRAFRVLTRAWGYMSDKTVPVTWRNTIYGGWGRIFNSNMNEIEHPLESFETFQDFFTRTLKPGSRPLHPSPLVSPCDGKILYCGNVNTSTWSIEQVKGVDFHLADFLNLTQTQLVQNFQQFNSDNGCLKFIIIYLGPGDYHRIHSPTSFQVDSLSHTPGHLISVNPIVAKYIPMIYSVNERVIWNGNWTPFFDEIDEIDEINEINESNIQIDNFQDFNSNSFIENNSSNPNYFFSLSMVGAYNVGSIRVEGIPDVDFKTNNPEHDTEAIALVGLGGKITPFARYNLTTEHIYQKGDLLGQFRLGSSVVMVFEAPIGTEFSEKVAPNELIQVGDPLVEFYEN